MADDKAETVGRLKGYLDKAHRSAVQLGSIEIADKIKEAQDILRGREKAPPSTSVVDPSNSQATILANQECAIKRDDEA